jgi:hypothetical protein
MGFSLTVIIAVGCDLWPKGSCKKAQIQVNLGSVDS